MSSSLIKAKKSLKNELVAQLVVHQTDNLGVVSSSLTQLSYYMVGIAQLVERFSVEE